MILVTDLSYSIYKTFPIPIRSTFDTGDKRM